MNKNDLKELGERLDQLAEALGGRAPGQKGILVWFDTLRECRFDDVQRALSDWPKSNIKMPAPADILKSCRSESSRRLEAEAERNRQLEPTVDSLLASEARAGGAANAKEELEKIRQILSKPRPEPKDWARRLKAREEAGEQLDVQQRRLWREALREGV